MKIVDFEKKGNVVRFYLGDDDCQHYYGDDWDDAPYDCNAGTVYDEYIKGYCDIAFPFEYVVMEPCDDYKYTNVPWCKNDMRDRKVPCIIAVKNKEHQYWEDCFSDALTSDAEVVKFYFGDKMDPSDGKFYC